MDQSKVERLSLHFDLPNPVAPSLQQQIQQLIKQRGALRNITKQSLQKEIDESGSDNGISGHDEIHVEDEDDDDTPQARQEKIWQTREEMLQKLAYAQNEILSALDFVSLLLSGKSVPAQSSMSPALKQVVPIGSLEGNAVEKQDVSSANKQKLSRVSDGWKSESFKTVSKKLSQAATRLDGEAQRQSKYWQQIAELKAQGWSVSRLPSDNRAIGVHYGFPEAAPQFRNRGFAHLQQDESGDLQFDPRSIPETPSVIRIAIIRGGTETGASSIHPAVENQEHRVIQQISSARDAIFEEELFHEISREARFIANQGARTQPKAVEASIDSETQIRIEQFRADEDEPVTPGGPDAKLAELVASNLRLLLLLEHSRSRLRRCEPSTTMSRTAQSSKEYALLRPVLTNLRHQASLSALQSICKNFVETCRQAGLSLGFDITKKQESENTTDIQRLRQPARSRVAVRLEGGQDIGIDVETYLGSPVYGTTYRNSTLDFGFVQYQPSVFSTMKEATEYLGYAMTLELVAQTPEFKVLKPHSGEVSLKGSNLEATIHVRSQQITLHVKKSVKDQYSWRLSTSDHEPAHNGVSKDKSFKNIVKMLNSRV